MDVQELNKSQLILLAILLSFITSIATGIVTVTLMQQAPVSVTAPINRVVKQTVEKITQVEGNQTVQTVIIKEEDLVVDAIAKNESAVFVISKEGLDENGKTIEISAGRGFTISTDGIIVADTSLVFDKENYFVKNSSGKFKAEFISTDKKGFSFLKIGVPLDEKNKLAYTVPTFGDLNKMRIGQKILVIGSTISSFIYEGDSNLKINTTKATAGALVSDLDGDVLGIALNGEVGPFVLIGDIINALNSKEVPKI
jgi:S1-C subfamily serine protease